MQALPLEVQLGSPEVTLSGNLAACGGVGVTTRQSSAREIHPACRTRPLVKFSLAVGIPNDYFRLSSRPRMGTKNGESTNPAILESSCF